MFEEETNNDNKSKSYPFTFKNSASTIANEVQSDFDKVLIQFLATKSHYYVRENELVAETDSKTQKDQLEKCLIVTGNIPPQSFLIH